MVVIAGNPLWKDFDMNYVSVSEDVELYAEDFGEGPPIVFICGGNLTHQSWDSQVAALADQFRTITFDWRGTGFSDKPRNGYNFNVTVQDVIALMEKRDVAPAVLVGHGLGAHIALLTTYARPDLVSGLFLTAAAPWFSGERDGQIGGVSEEFLRFMISQVRSNGSGLRVPYAQTCYELGENWVFHHRQSPGVYQAMLYQALAWPQYVLNAYAHSMREIDHRERLPQLRCPTLIAQGRHDRKQRYEGAVYMAGTIPGGRLHTFEESATMTNIEEVEVFNQVLADFVLDLERRRREAA
jgi:pimeloyl-ACP methyl ester carboxylesterase